MGFTHYYKVKLLVDNGFERYRYETYKYIFADSKDQAIQSILNYYNSQYDTSARIIEIYDYPIQDVMMFNALTSA